MKRRICAMTTTLALVSAFLPGCLSRTIHDARPAIRLARIEEARRTPSGDTFVVATLSNGERRTYGIVAGQPTAREFAAGGPSGESLVILPNAAGRDVTRQVWRSTVGELADGTPFVGFEHVDSTRDWSRSRYDAFIVAETGAPVYRRTIVAGLGGTDWSRPAAWLCAVAVPPAMLFDVVTGPVQFLVRPIETLSAWMEWTESW